jgi:hypothetical protein
MKKESLTADHVMIKFNEIELAMLTNVLAMFFEQDDKVFKSCGIKTKKMERKLSSLYARLDTTFWKNFDEATILSELWGISMDKARYDE